MRHKLILYEVGNTGLWKWRFETNKKTIARSDYKYSARSAALASFNGFIKTVSDGQLSSSCFISLNGNAIYNWSKTCDIKTLETLEDRTREFES